MDDSGDREAMVERDEYAERAQPEYDIQLWRDSPEALSAVFPRARTRRTRAQTALVGQVRDPAQFDSLLERLQSVGLVLDEIHRTEGSTASAGDGVATYEVRVEGEIGASLLCYLKWRHYAVPPQTRVRIAAGSAELLHCLKMVTEAGMSVERVRRVAYSSTMSATVAGDIGADSMPVQPSM